MSVVDSQLRVYGIDCLRIADASIMPRITTGNTMATCVVIGERAADLIRQTYGIRSVAVSAVAAADQVGPANLPWS
jgi:choline dehydrogenase